MNRFLQAFLSLLFFELLFCSYPLFAQLVLKPSIGVEVLPADNASMCAIPLAIDPGNLFVLPGLHEGDTVPDFQLYTPNNDAVHLADVMSDGKPVLLVGGNYTCPKYRNHLDELNDLQAAYGNQVHIYVIYTVEAHPQDPDISPYSGDVWELNSNIQLGIFYHEPLVYLDRKNAAQDMLNSLEVTVPVLLDGPCNEWWQSYALAPNPAFLISPDGTIYKKQGWLDNSLYAMSDAIDSLLESFPTSISEPKQDLLVMNDPASPLLKFVFPTSKTDGVITISNAAGKMVVAPVNFSGYDFTIDKNKLNPGIYLYSLHLKDVAYNGKFIVQ